MGKSRAGHRTSPSGLLGPAKVLLRSTRGVRLEPATKRHILSGRSHRDLVIPRERYCFHCRNRANLLGRDPVGIDGQCRLGAKRRKRPVVAWWARRSLQPPWVLATRGAVRGQPQAAVAVPRPDPPPPPRACWGLFAHPNVDGARLRGRRPGIRRVCRWGAWNQEVACSSAREAISRGEAEDHALVGHYCPGGLWCHAGARRGEDVAACRPPRVPCQVALGIWAYRQTRDVTNQAGLQKRRTRPER